MSERAFFDILAKRNTTFTVRYSPSGTSYSLTPNDPTVYAARRHSAHTLPTTELPTAAVSPLSDSSV